MLVKGVPDPIYPQRFEEHQHSNRHKSKVAAITSSSASSNIHDYDRGSVRNYNHGSVHEYGHARPTQMMRHQMADQQPMDLPSYGAKPPYDTIHDRKSRWGDREPLDLPQGLREPLVLPQGQPGRGIDNPR